MASIPLSHCAHHIQAELDALARQFDLSQDKLRAITSQFVADFALGLGEYKHAMAMIPTFVTDVPNGTEVGWVRARALSPSLASGLTQALSISPQNLPRP
jgi:hexokinase